MACYLPSTITYRPLVRVLVLVFVLGDLQSNRFRLNGDDTLLRSRFVRKNVSFCVELEYGLE